MVLKVGFGLSRGRGRRYFEFSRLVGCGTPANPDSVAGGLDNGAVIYVKERQFVKTEREVYRF